MLIWWRVNATPGQNVLADQPTTLTHSPRLAEISPREVFYVVKWHITNINEWNHQPNLARNIFFGKIQAAWVVTWPYPSRSTQQQIGAEGFIADFTVFVGTFESNAHANHPNLGEETVAGRLKILKYAWLTYTHMYIYIYIYLYHNYDIYIYVCIYIFAQIQSESNMAHIFSNWGKMPTGIHTREILFLYMHVYIYIHTLTAFNHQVYLLISCHQLRSTKKCISWTHMVSIRKQQHIFWLSRQINIILCLRLSRNDSVTNKILTPKYFPMTAIFDGEIFMFDCQFTLSTSRKFMVKAC